MVMLNGELETRRLILRMFQMENAQTQRLFPQWEIVIY
jgi:hypothetical protein